ncbi:hypothetical protein A33Q_1869 [Indibacter alkaliphilus LW1]|uniref:Uncharacterized protein n=1 Tax=Indibacter alkaliphilus (strain CCUG 57479 / KCTC 22604 / LW1) TaxID=1189612 RepID=S2DXT7_INDAL|nr:hypothetical protein [Indibacter alkaliphilus]EOZ96951.1 hypothetical protein A33Q_1869 [Indibacter alkaliphilus LW1]
MVKKLFIFFVFSGVFNFAFGQNDVARLDSLEKTVLLLEKEVYNINLNLHQSQSQLKAGILVATVGYTVTIIGGQLLGTRPQLGEALLYAGGAIGIAGTVVLVRGFNKISLGPPRPPKRYQP